MTSPTRVTFAWLGGVAVRTDEIVAVGHRTANGASIYLRNGAVLESSLPAQRVLDELVKANA